MREAYLLNLSSSVTYVPLYERLTVTVGGREVQKVQFKTLKPGEELIVGRDIDSKQKRYYRQFKAIMIELKFRDVKNPVVEEPKGSEDSGAPINSVSTPATQDTPVATVGDETTTLADSDLGGTPVTQDTLETYDVDILKKKRQAELIEIAIGLGLEATEQDSKATIIERIVGKTSV